MVKQAQLVKEMDYVNPLTPALHAVGVVAVVVEL
jgi:hypothetical protein